VGAFHNSEEPNFEPCVLRTQLPIFVRPWLDDMRPTPPNKSKTPKLHGGDASLRTHRKMFVHHSHAPCVLMTQCDPQILPRSISSTQCSWSGLRIWGSGFGNSCLRGPTRDRLERVDPLTCLGFGLVCWAALLRLWNSGCLFQVGSVQHGGFVDPLIPLHTGTKLPNCSLVL